MIENVLLSFGESRSVRLREVSVLKCPSYRGYFNRKCITFIRGSRSVRLTEVSVLWDVRLKRFDCSSGEINCRVFYENNSLITIFLKFANHNRGSS